VDVRAVSNQSNQSVANVGVPYPNVEVEDDWVDGSDRLKNQNDDWGDEEESSLGSQEIREKPKNYEFPQEPKTQSWSGSVYSFGYREPKNTGVGQTESIYDANFRVITPPYSPPSPGLNLTNQNSNNSNDEEDEDWGLDDEDVDRDRT
jgi:hypothetical protein